MEDQTPVRYGIMGCASIARKLSRAMGMAPSATLGAVASKSLDKAREFINNNIISSEDVNLHGSYESLLEDSTIDAVYIPLPTILHLEWAVKAANKKKHVLLDRPVALSVKDFDTIAEACEKNGVQFMDGTMWMHNLRTHIISTLMADPLQFGAVKTVHSTFTLPLEDTFSKEKDTVNGHVDALGALGDLGWHCLRAMLCVNGYRLPKTVTALPGYEMNSDGVLVSCGAQLVWDNGAVGTFHCGFGSTLSMDLIVNATRGAVRLHDFAIPYDESCASYFSYCGGKTRIDFEGYQNEWDPPTEHRVELPVPQEALMVEGFSKLVMGVKDCGLKPDGHWVSISRKTQMLVNAVLQSIKGNLVPVDVSHEIVLPHSSNNV